MHWLQKGYDVWGIDFTGEGSASYPPSMSISPAPQGVYPLEAKDAVKELKDGVDYIVKKLVKNQLIYSDGRGAQLLLPCIRFNTLSRLIIWCCMDQCILQS